MMKVLREFSVWVVHREMSPILVLPSLVLKKKYATSKSYYLYHYPAAENTRGKDSTFIREVLHLFRHR